MIRLIKIFVLSFFVVPIYSVSSVAQQLTWLEILSPDRVIETLTKYSVVLARTQVDLTACDISTNLRGNRTTISDLKIWPATPWFDGEVCQIGVERVVLSGQPFSETNVVKFGIDAYETTLTPGCIHPEIRTGMERLDLIDLSVPSISLNIDYHFPSARADVSVLASVAGFFEISSFASFDYLSVRFPSGRGDPYPVAVLSKASLAVRNLGGWTAVSKQLPALFTNKATAGAAIEALLENGLKELNRDSFDRDTEELTILQQAMISSVKDAWTEFLNSSDQLVLETNIAPESLSALNFWTYEDNPSWIIRDLNPIMKSVDIPATAQIVPKSSVEALLSDNWRELPEDQRLQLGLALAQGNGVPSNGTLAAEILAELARGGRSEAAAAIAVALEQQDPETSYFWSLHAGDTGEQGAVSRLDRLESALPLQAVLRLQDEALGDTENIFEAPLSLFTIRKKAREHMSGKGEFRNYRQASVWASIGAALGDPASKAIEVEISKTLGMAEDLTVTNEFRQRVSREALTLWAELAPGFSATGHAATVSVDAELGAGAPDSVVGSEEAVTQTPEACHPQIVETLPGDYGGSCAQNNAVLLRELALVTRELETLRAGGPRVRGQVNSESSSRRSSRVQLENELAERVAREVEMLGETEELHRRLELQQAVAAEHKQQAEVLNAQVETLRRQLGQLNELLTSAQDRDQENTARVEALGAQLNTALARAAAEERRRAEQAERLAAEVRASRSDAEKVGEFRSLLLSNLSAYLGNRADVDIVGDRLVFSSGALFQPGTTTLSPEGRAQIADVMDSFLSVSEQIPGNVDWIFHVDGHTDNVPITSGAFADNWELSQERALSVVRFLTDERNFPPHRLAAVGFGEYRPVRPNTSDASRAKNRRIEIFLTAR